MKSVLYYLVVCLLFACQPQKPAWNLEELSSSENEIVQYVKQQFGATDVLIKSWEPKKSEINWSRVPDGIPHKITLFKFLTSTKGSKNGEIGLAAWIGGELYPLDPSAKARFPEPDTRLYIEVDPLRLTAWLESRTEVPPLVILRERG